MTWTRVRIPPPGSIGIDPIAVLFDEKQGWLTVGMDGWETCYDDMEGWLELVPPAPPCETCGQPVPPSLVADGCPLCEGCLVGSEPRPPAGSVAAALVERGLPATAPLERLLAAVRNATLADLVRAYDRRAGTGRGSWSLAASYARRRMTRGD